MVRQALAMGLWTFATLAAALPCAASTPAGVAAAVRGMVTLERTGSVGIAVQTGVQIYLGDRIATGPEGGLQVLLLDESVFTLGPNSALVVDRFVYDPKDDAGELQTELVRGAFRFVSGKIAKRDPTRMNVKLPAGTIGVRGTIVGAQVDPTTGRSLVWLAGPGAGNVAGIPAGSIAVENAGVVQDVGRSGWGVEIPSFSAPPSEPFQVPDSSYGTLGFEVAPQGGSPSSGDDDDDANADASADADATSAQPQPAASPAPLPSAPTSGPGLLAPLALLPGGDAPTAPLVPIVPEPLGPIANPIPVTDMMEPLMTTPPPIVQFTQTTLDDLGSFSAGFDGKFNFVLNDVPFQSGTGDLDLIVAVDFIADVIGVQVQGVHASFGTRGDGVGFTSVPFNAGLGGDARYMTQFFYLEMGSSPCSNGCPVQVQLGLQNIPTQIAGQLNATVGVGQVSQILETTVPQSVPITTIQNPNTTSP